MFSLFKNEFNFIFIILANPFSIFNSLVSFKLNKTIYSSCGGTFIVFRNVDLSKRCVDFLLPSGKFFYTNIFVFGFFGKKQYKFRSSNFNLFFKKGDMKVRVSGVSMNPVDHHNGGRSNRKPLFLNKYGSVAKFGK